MMTSGVKFSSRQWTLIVGGIHRVCKALPTKQNILAQSENPNYIHQESLNI
jgi:hypothetical protein